MLRQTTPLLSATLMAALVLSGCNKGSTEAGEPKKPECIAPAKPGGGFDLTCKLAQSGLKDTKQLNSPMRVTYMPGGVGAVAYNKIVANDPANNDAIIAFSTGLNQGRVKSMKNFILSQFVGWILKSGTQTGTQVIYSQSHLPR